MLLFFLLVSSAITFNVYSQAGVYKTHEKIYSIVDEMPMFPGGEKELYKYLNAVPLPAEYKSSGNKITVRFLVDTMGYVRDVEIKQGAGDDNLNQIAVSHIKNMPQWKPGRTMGTLAIVQYILPLPFGPVPSETGRHKKKNNK